MQTEETAILKALDTLVGIEIAVKLMNDIFTLVKENPTDRCYVGEQVYKLVSPYLTEDEKDGEN